MMTIAFATHHQIAPSESFVAGRLFGTSIKDVLEEPIRTPKTDIPHNFGPISKRDQILFTSERPGNAPKEGAHDAVQKEKVDEWISFMKSKGIKHVLVLLDANELEIYPEQGLIELYKAGGMEAHLTPMGNDSSFSHVMDILRNVEQNNEKAVTHCTGGTRRAGRVAAAWLSTRYNLIPREATEEAIDAALEGGVQRGGDVEKLVNWMERSSRVE